MADSFNTTRWSIVEKARGSEPELRRDALQELLTCYMPALRAHLVRRKRISPELADELLQGFLVKNVVEGKLIERADASAGKFRSWLLKWLENYVRHELSRAKRETPVEEIEDADEVVSADGFDTDWARTTLSEAIRVMRSECERDDKVERWTIFQRRLLAPLLSGVEPADYDDLVTQLKLESKAQAQNHLVSGKRHFNRSLEFVISRYAENEDDVRHELQELQRVLANATAREAVELHDERTISAGELERIVSSDPQRLVKLFDLNVSLTWERCLGAPLTELLEHSEATEHAETTLRDGLHSKETSLALLQSLKKFGNSLIQTESVEWPVDVGLAIYLTAIAAGQVRYGKWISNAPPTSLQPGFDYLRTSGWVDSTTLEIHKRALEQSRGS